MRAAKYPVKRAYELLKLNAKRRNKPFAITLEYFEAACRKTKYIAGKGKTKTSYTLDCKIAELGYVPGNIQILELADNASKGKMLMYDWQQRTGRVIEIIDFDTNENPF